MLGALTLLAALAIGMWWNASLLNETERKLVGVWERVEHGRRSAMFLLVDRRVLFATHTNGVWAFLPAPYTWKASPAEMHLHMPLSLGRTPSEWIENVKRFIAGENRSTVPVVWKSNDEFRAFDGEYHRSDDGYLLTTFDQVSAVESP